MCIKIIVHRYKQKSLQFLIGALAKICGSNFHSCDWGYPFFKRGEPEAEYYPNCHLIHKRDLTLHTYHF